MSATRKSVAITVLACVLVALAVVAAGAADPAPPAAAGVPGDARPSPSPSPSAVPAASTTLDAEAAAEQIEDGLGPEASDASGFVEDYDPEEPGPSSSHRMAETVVTGTKTERSVDEAPVPTQVISRKAIDQTATVSIEQALDQIPDLYVQQNVEFGLGASVVRMQGADPNKVAIVLDGQRFRGGIDGVVDLRDIRTGEIEQIEIIRGPASSLYGSDAMAGVINIRTRTGGEEPTVNATAAGGSYSQQVYKLAHGWKVGPVNYFLSYQHDEVALAQLFGAISAQFEDSNELQKRDGIFARVDYPTETQELRITTDYLNERNPLSTSDDLTNGIAWTWRPFQDWSIDLAGSRYGFDRTNDLPGFIEDVTYADWNPEARVTAPRFTVAGTDHVGILGIRYRYETYDSPEQIIGDPDSGVVAPGVDESATQISPFLQDEIYLGEQWSLVLGLSLDDHNRYGLEVNPRGTLLYRPWDVLQIGFTAGRGFRAPDLLQLFDIDVNNVALVNDRVTGYAIVGNPNLKAETDVAFNLEINAQPLPGVRSSLIFYRHDFKDLIANVIACPSPTMCQPGFVNPFPELQGPIFSFANVSAAQTQGIDFSVDLFPLDWFPDLQASLMGHDVKFTVGYGYLDTENQSGLPNEDGKQLPFRPKNRVLPSITWAQDDWESTIRIWGQYESEIFTDLANTQEGRIRPHWFWNFKLSQELGGAVRAFGGEAPRWLEGAGMFVQGLNVFDEVLDAAAVAAQERQFSARASFLGGVTYRF